MPIIRQVPLEHCIKSIQSLGVGIVRSAFSDDAVASLRKEVAQLQFRKCESIVGPHKVQQYCEVADTFPKKKSVILTLRDEIQTHWNEVLAGPRYAKFISEPLNFNDVRVQKYVVENTEGLGISAHHDGARFINLIMVLLLEGDGRFALCSTRDAIDPFEVPHQPGDMIVMRGPGFLGTADQPFHFVDRIRKKRVTIGFRHNSKITTAAAS